MKKIIAHILIGLLVTNTCVYAHSVISGTIRDSETGKGIESAQVMVYTKGTLTDLLGYFSIPVDSVADRPVELYIRHIQYKPVSLLVNNTVSHVNVELETHIFATKDITITAEQPVEYNSTVSTKVIGKKEIEKTVPSVVADVLTSDPAIHTKSHYQSPVVMRGLTGHRLLVLRNGNRRFGSYPAGFMTHTINIYDLEKIEIHKGPASVVYGPGAIAGIINLIDKSPFKSKGVNFRYTTGYASNNGEQSNLLCGGWSNGKFAAKAAIRARNANPYRFADDTQAVNSFYKDKDLFTALGYHNRNHDLQLHIEMHRGGPWGSPLGFSGTRYLYVNTSHENNDNVQLDWNYTTDGVLKSLEFAAYYAKEYREQGKLYLNAGTKTPSYREDIFYTDSYYGARLSPEFRLNDKIKLKSGTDFFSFRISTPMNMTDYYESLYFENRISRNARSFTLGAYSELEIKPRAGTTALAGIRYDMSAVYEGEVFSHEQEKERSNTVASTSGNVAIIKWMGNTQQLKLNFARSFRMPTPQEMFTNTFTANGILYGNPDLAPETSLNADLVWSFFHPVISLNVSPFFWLLQSMITKEIVFDMPGLNYRYVNIGNARIWGGEVSAVIHKNNAFLKQDQMQFQFGFAYTNGTDITRGPLGTSNGPLDHIPPMQMRIGADYDIALKSVFISTNIGLQYFGFQDRLPESAMMTPSYILCSAMLGLTFKTRQGTSTVRLVVNNLLNNYYYAFQSFVPGKGRDIRLMWSYNIG